MDTIVDIITVFLPIIWAYYSFRGNKTNWRTPVDWDAPKKTLARLVDAADGVPRAQLEATVAMLFEYVDRCHHVLLHDKDVLPLLLIVSDSQTYDLDQRTAAMSELVTTVLKQQMAWREGEKKSGKDKLVSYNLRAACNNPLLHPKSGMLAKARDRGELGNFIKGIDLLAASLLTLEHFKKGPNKLLPGGKYRHNHLRRGHSVLQGKEYKDFDEYTPFQHKLVARLVKEGMPIDLATVAACQFKGCETWDDETLATARYYAEHYDAVLEHLAGSPLSEEDKMLNYCSMNDMLKHSDRPRVGQFASAPPPVTPPVPAPVSPAVAAPVSRKRQREERRYEINSIQASWVVGFFRVWWLGYQTPTEEPRQSLLEDGVSACDLDAVAAKGPKAAPTTWGGARLRSGRETGTTTPQPSGCGLSGHHGNDGVSVLATELRVRFRYQGSRCVPFAFLNVYDASRGQKDRLLQVLGREFCSLKDLCNPVQKVFKFSMTPQHNKDLAWLLAQTDGRFVVLSGVHAVGVDCARRLVFDAADEFALRLCPAALYRCGITRVDEMYAL